MSQNYGPYQLEVQNASFGINAGSPPAEGTTITWSASTKSNWQLQVTADLTPTGTDNHIYQARLMPQGSTDLYVAYDPNQGASLADPGMQFKLAKLEQSTDPGNLVVYLQNQAKPDQASFEVIVVDNTSGLALSNTDVFNNVPVSATPLRSNDNIIDFTKS